MFGRNIKKQVMKVLNEKIEAQQKAHEEHCEMIDREAEEAKNQHFEDSVKTFVGKFL